MPLPVVVDPHADPSDETPIVTVSRKNDGGYLDVALVFAASPDLLALHDVEPAEPLLSTLPEAAAEIAADGSTLWLSNTSGPPQAVNQVQPLDATYTSLPSTLLTTDEVGSRGWTTLDVGWLLARAAPFTPDDLSALRDLASRKGLVVEAPEERRDVTSLRLGALAIGIAVALAVLAMTTGLIRVEAGQTRRVPTAVGASSGLSRSLTATTGGSIALSGAVLGITASYVILAAGYVDDRGTLASVPTVELAVILVGFPVVAALGAWAVPSRTDEALTRPMPD